MKRTVLAAFCILAFCSFGLAMKAGPVRAYQEGWEVNDYMAQRTPVIDGTWTTLDEWTDAEEKPLVGEVSDLNVIFRLKYDTNYPEWVNQYYLIEFFNDTTNDAGDYWQICYDSAAVFGEPPIGGTTPNTNCDRFDFQGHDPSSGTHYFKGTGTTWAEFTNFTMPTDIEWANTISASPLDSNPHWIAEIKIEHIHFNIQPEFWIRIAAYDVNNADAGYQAWPDSDAATPDDWGLMIAVDDVIPEGLSIGVVVLLTSVAALIASRHVRKRSRTESCSAGKREK